MWAIYQRLRLFLLHSHCKAHGPDYIQPWIPGFSICRQMSNQAINLSWQRQF